MQPVREMPAPPSNHLGTINHLTLVCTGGMAATVVPTWLLALRSWYPSLTVDTVLTHSASQLVSPAALRAVGGREPILPGPGAGPVHRRLAEETDLVLVFPMTLNFLSKLSLMITDSTALYIAAIAQCPVVAAPSVPAVAWQTAMVQTHVRNLRGRGVYLMEPVNGIAAYSGRLQESAAPTIGEVLAFIDQIAVKTEQEVHSA